MNKKDTITTIAILFSGIVALKVIASMLGAINDIPGLSNIFELVGLFFTLKVIITNIKATNRAETISTIQETLQETGITEQVQTVTNTIKAGVGAANTFIKKDNIPQEFAGWEEVVEALVDFANDVHDMPKEFNLSGEDWLSLIGDSEEDWVSRGKETETSEPTQEVLQERLVQWFDELDEVIVGTVLLDPEVTTSSYYVVKNPTDMELEIVSGPYGAEEDALAEITSNSSEDIMELLSTHPAVIKYEELYSLM